MLGKGRIRALLLLGCRAMLRNRKVKPSPMQQPRQCRFSSGQSCVENSQRNELLAPGERECSGNSWSFSLAASQAASEVVCAVMVIGFQLIAAKL